LAENLLAYLENIPAQIGNYQYSFPFLDRQYIGQGDPHRFLQALIAGHVDMDGWTDYLFIEPPPGGGLHSFIISPPPSHSHEAIGLPLLEWIMAEAPTIKVKTVRERRTRERRKGKVKQVVYRQKAINPRRR
jgi:hypothetical protein